VDQADRAYPMLHALVIDPTVVLLRDGAAPLHQATKVGGATPTDSRDGSAGGRHGSTTTDKDQLRRGKKKGGATPPMGQKERGDFF
jgi:hypothetical protein